MFIKVKIINNIEVIAVQDNDAEPFINFN